MDYLEKFYLYKEKGHCQLNKYWRIDDHCIEYEFSKKKQ